MSYGYPGQGYGGGPPPPQNYGPPQQGYGQYPPPGQWGPPPGPPGPGWGYQNPQYPVRLPRTSQAREGSKAVLRNHELTM